jgi:hypothetical protein
MKKLTLKQIATLFFSLLSIIVFISIVDLLFFEVNVDINFIGLAFFELVSFSGITVFLSLQKN